jgi:intracellular multiplication protein IcmK
MELLPSDPEEIMEMRRLSDSREAAMADLPPSELRARTEEVRLEPGFSPPRIVLSPGLATAAVFMDSTGSPWPIASSVLGSSSLYSAEVLEGPAGNQVIVSPRSAHGHSNLVITLAGSEIPLVIRLETFSGLDSGRQVDGLVIYQIQGRGPSAKPPVAKSLTPATVSESLYSFLDGLPPEGAEPVRALPPSGEYDFHALGGRYYLRTRLSLIWPGPAAQVSGAGGYSVYEMDPVSSVLLAGPDEKVSRVALGPAFPEEAGE